MITLEKITRKLYASFGFVESGDISGGELVARLELGAGENKNGK